ncbi:hypothetical protein BDZ90DRAFT_278820 [Jaminaea rosea]|uniref:Uncharacterized protein n=1 Tax=Jaminaea rosea TaxID=1569628 RepID=A0A316UZ78_9BASI|nr:hypothetical protein BDZ90DRAFT_278820 [Jaminaea rosea]PWN28455.1 hypothetical protein BDZ90DRAFT_278820 [Jaminaea rosea]
MSTSQRYQAHSPDAVAPPSASAGPSTARRPSSAAMDEDDATDEERPSATPASARGRRRSSASTRPRKPSISAGGAAANDGSASASAPIPGSAASAQAVKASRGPNSQVNYKIKFHKSRDRYHKVLEQNTELTKGYREAQAKERKLDEELNWIVDSIAKARPELLAAEGATMATGTGAVGNAMQG